MVNSISSGVLGFSSVMKMPLPAPVTPLRFAVPLKPGTVLLAKSCAVTVTPNGCPADTGPAMALHTKWCSAPVPASNALLVPVCPAPSPAVSTMAVSAVTIVMLPVHIPLVKVLTAAGVTVTAPPLPVAVSETEAA